MEAVELKIRIFEKVYATGLEQSDVDARVNHYFDLIMNTKVGQLANKQSDGRGEDRKKNPKRK